jgi:hypothetical protein
MNAIDLERNSITARTIKRVDPRCSTTDEEIDRGHSCFGSRIIVHRDGTEPTPSHRKPTWHYYRSRPVHRIRRSDEPCGARVVSHCTDAQTCACVVSVSIVRRLPGRGPRTCAEQLLLFRPLTAQAWRQELETRRDDDMYPSGLRRQVRSNRHGNKPASGNRPHARPKPTHATRRAGNVPLERTRD